MRVAFRSVANDFYLIVAAESGRTVGTIRLDGTNRWADESARWVVADKATNSNVRVVHSLEAAEYEASGYFSEFEFCTVGCGQVVRGHRTCDRCFSRQEAILGAWRLLEQAIPKNSTDGSVWVRLEAGTKRDSPPVDAYQAERAYAIAANVEGRRLQLIEVSESEYDRGYKSRLFILGSAGTTALRDVLNSQFPPDE